MICFFFFKNVLEVSEMSPSTDSYKIYSISKSSLSVFCLVTAVVCFFRVLCTYRNVFTLNKYDTSQQNYSRTIFPCQFDVVT